MLILDGDVQKLEASSAIDDGYINILKLVLMFMGQRLYSKKT